METNWNDKILRGFFSDEQVEWLDRNGYVASRTNHLTGTFLEGGYVLSRKTPKGVVVVRRMDYSRKWQTLFLPKGCVFYKKIVKKVPLKRALQLAQTVR